MSYSHDLYCRRPLASIMRCQRHSQNAHQAVGWEQSAADRSPFTSSNLAHLQHGTFSVTSRVSTHREAAGKRVLIIAL